MNKYLLNGLIDFNTYEKCEAFRKTLGRGEPDIQLKEDGVGGISIRTSDYYENIGDENTYGEINICDISLLKGKSKPEYIFDVRLHKNGFVIDSIKCHSIDEAAETYVSLLNKVVEIMKESDDIEIEPGEYDD